MLLGAAPFLANSGRRGLNSHDHRLGGIFFLLQFQNCEF
jgi:hypothetical protein